MIVRISIQQPTLLQALRDVPSTKVIWEEMNITEHGDVILLFWAESNDYEAFEAAIRSDSTVRNPKCLTTFSDRRLYQVEQVGEGRMKSAHSALVESGAIIQQGVGTHEGWTLQIAFPTHDALQQYCALYEDAEVQFTLLAKYEQPHGRQRGDLGLTEKQEQILFLAAKRGYYKVPRKVDLSDLADELGISHQAASERLRRAVDVLICRSVSTDLSPPPKQSQ